MSITKAAPGTTRIGWIGTGVMGRWMCQHLMTKGYAATVYNRTKERAQPLLDAGATWADTPSDVARRSDVVFAIVGFPKDVRSIPRVKGRFVSGAAGACPSGHDDKRTVVGARFMRRLSRKALPASTRRCQAATWERRTPRCR